MNLTQSPLGPRSPVPVIVSSSSIITLIILILILILLLLLLIIIIGGARKTGPAWPDCVSCRLVVASSFQSFGLAMLSLLRFSTGEGWADFTRDLAEQASPVHSCPLPSPDGLVRRLKA
jgi:hypothetical protein